jgi:hypothetical protein
LLAFLQ